MNKTIELESFRRLRLKKGDVLFFSFPFLVDNTELEVIYKELRDSLNKFGWKDIPLIFIPYKMKIGIINKEEIEK